jgi:hypothetical protein
MTQLAPRAVPRSFPNNPKAARKRTRPVQNAPKTPQEKAFKKWLYGITTSCPIVKEKARVATCARGLQQATRAHARAAPPICNKTKRVQRGAATCNKTRCHATCHCATCNRCAGLATWRRDLQQEAPTCNVPLRPLWRLQQVFHVITTVVRCNKGAHASA